MTNKNRDAQLETKIEEHKNEPYKDTEQLKNQEKEQTGERKNRHINKIKKNTRIRININDLYIGLQRKMKNSGKKHNKKL